MGFILYSGCHDPSYKYGIAISEVVKWTYNATGSDEGEPMLAFSLRGEGGSCRTLLGREATDGYNKLIGNGDSANG